MSISADCSTWSSNNWPTGGPIPTRTWTRESKTFYCSDEFTRNQLNMRRKAQVLQHNQNQNNWTKSERYSYLVRNKTGTIKTKSPSLHSQQILFNGGVYIPNSPNRILCSNTKTPSIPKSSNFLLVTGNRGNTILRNPTSSSNVPLDKKNPQYLYFDNSVPLTNWKYKLQYGSQGGKNIVVNKNI